MRRRYKTVLKLALVALPLHSPELHCTVKHILAFQTYLPLERLSVNVCAAHGDLGSPALPIRFDENSFMPRDVDR